MRELPEPKEEIKLEAKQVKPEVKQVTQIGEA
jgi:hypothetical protein